jgi:hypothetical protein
MRRTWVLSACLTISFTLCVPAGAQTTTPAKHPFSPKDWALLHSAQAIAVSPDGIILYVVTFGDDHGPTHEEWWTIASDGTHAAKLDTPEGFSPMGFTRDGHHLYGTWKINNLPQLAVFLLQDAKVA